MVKDYTQKIGDCDGRLGCPSCWNVWYGHENVNDKYGRFYSPHSWEWHKISNWYDNKEL